MTAMVTRGVCRATPAFLATTSEAVTIPRAIKPRPPSFSLANRKMMSPAAMRLPPYMVFSAMNTNVSARVSGAAALMANAMSVTSRCHIPDAKLERKNSDASGSRNPSLKPLDFHPNLNST
jgi:hypothetical protein